MEVFFYYTEDTKFNSQIQFQDNSIKKLRYFPRRLCLIHKIKTLKTFSITHIRPV
jgi:hypothetical protein